MSENILGLIPQADWLEVGLDVSRPNDPIDAIMPDERTDNILAAWQTIASQYRAPLTACFHGFDTESLKTFQLPVDARSVEKGLIKVKLNQSERLQLLLRAGVREEQMPDYVLRDGLRLAEQVVTRSKVAKAELLATGKVTIQENNLDLTVDYGVPADQLSLTIDLSQGKGVDQLQAVVDTAAGKGISLSGLVASRKSLSLLRHDPSIRAAVTGSAEGQVTRAGLAAYLSDEFGITKVLTHDLTYGVDSGLNPDGSPKVTVKRYFPEGKVSFFAANGAGQVGAGLWGDPPEAALPGAAAADGAAVPFVYVSQYMEWDPAVLWTKASGLFMPVLFDPSGLFVATISE